jgi:hypothetical protein
MEAREETVPFVLILKVTFLVCQIEVVFVLPMIAANIL